MRQRVQIEQLVVGQLQTNCYLVIDNETKQALIIDPGDDAEYIEDRLNKLKARPVIILATHGHFDHLLAAYALQLAYHISFLAHQDDRFLIASCTKNAKYFLGLTKVDPAPRVTQTVKEGDTITLGASKLSIVHLPGHTPGSIGLWQKEAGILLVGDTVFADGAIGRTDFSYSDPDKLQSSLRRILAYPRKTRLFPGHGEVTTVAKERRFHRV